MGTLHVMLQSKRLANWLCELSALTTEAILAALPLDYRLLADGVPILRDTIF